MGDCSNGCGGCKTDNCDTKDDCNGSCSCGGSCGDSCDCDAKYAVAYNQAMSDNGMKCLLCNYFHEYALPNRCDGTLICYKCRDTRSWQIPKGKWKK